MWSIFDHLNALVVAPVVALIAIGAYFGLQTDRVGAVTRAASVSALTQTVDWIERDLDNLGAGAPDSVTAVLAYDWREPSASVTFLTGADTSLTAPAQTVRYERVPTGAGTYELRRFEVGAAGERLTARSPATLDALDLALLGANGASVADGDFGAVRSVVLRLSMATDGTPVEWSQRFFLHPSSF